MPNIKTAVLTNTNPSVNMENTAGSVEISGTFTGPATVTQSLTGGGTTIATFTVDSTIYTKANYLTWGITGGNGPITIKWYADVTNTDNSLSNQLRRNVNT
jgi:hypothetical protein